MHYVEGVLELTYCVPTREGMVLAITSPLPFLFPPHLFIPVSTSPPSLAEPNPLPTSLMVWPTNLQTIITTCETFGER